MIPQTAQTLKSYFQNGDKPTQEQFGELIDTMYYLYQQAVNYAESLANLSGGIATAWVDATWLGGAQGGWTYTKKYNMGDITIVRANTTGGVFQYYRINFAQPFPDIHYMIVDAKFIQSGNIYHGGVDQTTAHVTLGGSIRVFSTNAPPVEGTIVRGVFF